MRVRADGVARQRRRAHLQPLVRRQRQLRAHVERLVRRQRALQHVRAGDRGAGHGRRRAGQDHAAGAGEGREAGQRARGGHGLAEGVGVVLRGGVHVAHAAAAAQVVVGLVAVRAVAGFHVTDAFLFAPAGRSVFERFVC